MTNEASRIAELEAGIRRIASLAYPNAGITRLARIGEIARRLLATDTELEANGQRSLLDA